MKKHITKIILMFLPLIIIMSCMDFEQEPYEDLSDNYFPLRVGNEWHYSRIECDSITFQINTKRNIHGIEYYSRISSDVYDPIYFRKDSGIVYWLHNDTEYVYLDFNRDTNDVWSHLPNWNRWIESKIDTFGQYYDCITVVSECSLSINRSIYAPGVGFVYHYHDFKHGYSICPAFGLDWGIINDGRIDL
jgi:hypothetical protein